MPNYVSERIFEDSIENDVTTLQVCLPSIENEVTTLQMCLPENMQDLVRNLMQSRTKLTRLPDRCLYRYDILSNTISNRHFNIFLAELR